ncbi:MAG: DUF3145 domain-containing protein [Propionibacteriaceae bacterium]
MSQTRGVLYIHSSPSALCPHIEWGVGAVVGAPVHFDWIDQPAQRATLRTEYSWSGSVGTGAALTTALKGWQRLRFEVTEEATNGSEGSRWSYTPDLGLFHATIGLHGDVMISENRLKQALTAASHDQSALTIKMAELLGTWWDDELEVFRHAGEGTPVRWLHQAV